jgi:hypothetical protein
MYSSPLEYRMSPSVATLILAAEYLHEDTLAVAEQQLATANQKDTDTGLAKPAECGHTYNENKNSFRLSMRKGSCHATEKNI